MRGVVSHHEREIAELSADRELALEYLKAAMESLDNPDDRAADLLALCTVAEAHGGRAVVAAEAGISHESFARCCQKATRLSKRCLLFSRQSGYDYPSNPSITHTFKTLRMTT
ncbi:MAG: hypothetical protein ABI284_08860 [Nitrosospira sp.]